MRNFRFWKQVQQTEGECIVCTVIAHSGSSPGKTGFKLAIFKSGNIIGTIGGGRMEFSLIKMILSEQPKEPIIKKLVHQELNKDSSGLICSGEQTIFIEFLRRQKIKEILNGYVRKEFLVYNSSGISIEAKENPQIFSEKLDIKNKLHIFGGGHVGQAISKVFNTLDFQVIIYDERDINFIKEHMHADILEIKNFDKSIPTISTSGDNFLIICTTSFDSDLKVLELLYNSNIKPVYLGLMGSSAKIKKIFHLAVSNGVSLDFLQKIDAPMGIKVSDGTAEEIAISVASKVLQIKNYPNDHHHQNCNNSFI